MLYEVITEPDVAMYTSRVVELRDGRVIRDEPVPDRKQAAASVNPEISGHIKEKLQ